ncbi:MAG: CvpA family protein [Clostridia bacterium]|jgi:uncharacterized membrane protein required for colicin V production|nr:CvpA family protein [Clostridia bacterium]
MITDLILILIISVCTFLGYKRGLIKLAVRILGFFTALIIALVLYTPISNYIINNTDIVPNLKETIEEKIYTKKDDDSKESNNNENIGIIESAEKYFQDYTESVKENASSAVSEQIAIAIVRVSVWIGIFLGTKLLMLIVNLFADAIASIPVIKQFNKVGGVLYGFLEGMLILYVGLAIFSMVQPMIGENSLHIAIQNSFICKLMYENNIILRLIL